MEQKKDRATKKARIDRCKCQCVLNPKFEKLHDLVIKTKDEQGQIITFRTSRILMALHSPVWADLITNESIVSECIDFQQYSPRVVQLFLRWIENERNVFCKKPEHQVFFEQLLQIAVAYNIPLLQQDCENHFMPHSTSLCNDVLKHCQLAHQLHLPALEKACITFLAPKRNEWLDRILDILTQQGHYALGQLLLWEQKEQKQLDLAVQKLYEHSRNCSQSFSDFFYYHQNDQIEKWTVHDLVVQQFQKLQEVLPYASCPSVKKMLLEKDAMIRCRSCAK